MLSTKKERSLKRLRELESYCRKRLVNDHEYDTWKGRKTTISWMIYEMQMNERNKARKLKLLNTRQLHNI